MFDILNDRDNNTLEEINKTKEKRKKTVKTVLSRGKLNRDELDEMFLE
ncbi:MAG: hypothetical protein ACLFTR_02860 [Candidatus Woesearchaeota archaeon]